MRDNVSFKGAHAVEKKYRESSTTTSTELMKRNYAFEEGTFVVDQEPTEQLREQYEKYVYLPVYYSTGENKRENANLSSNYTTKIAQLQKEIDKLNQKIKEKDLELCKETQKEIEVDVTTSSSQTNSFAFTQTDVQGKKINSNIELKINHRKAALEEQRRNVLMRDYKIARKHSLQKYDLQQKSQKLIKTITKLKESKQKECAQLQEVTEAYHTLKSYIDNNISDLDAQSSKFMNEVTEFNPDILNISKVPEQEEPKEKRQESIKSICFQNLNLQLINYQIKELDHTYTIQLLRDGERILQNQIDILLRLNENIVQHHNMEVKGLESKLVEEHIKHVQNDTQVATLSTTIERHKKEINKIVQSYRAQQEEINKTHQQIVETNKKYYENTLKEKESEIARHLETQQKLQEDLFEISSCKMELSSLQSEYRSLLSEKEELQSLYDSFITETNDNIQRLTTNIEEGKNQIKTQFLTITQQEQVIHQQNTELSERSTLHSKQLKQYEREANEMISIQTKAKEEIMKQFSEINHLHQLVEERNTEIEKISSDMNARERNYSSQIEKLRLEHNIAMASYMTQISRMERNYEE